ncbi:MAG: 4-(cytidine 5'-diphospho)-2-C-methyl-D-erythritol kinase [Halanaerobiales bacterium]
MNKIKLKAPAKINLSLSINGLREDGFHELEMIMQAVSLYDYITLEKIEKGIEIHCDDKRIPIDYNNLAYQAAELIINKYSINRGIKIIIEKNIPLAAGLAGGSTDAAAVLKGISKLFSLNLAKKKLYNLAKEIGSDVSFCTYGGTALATSRGEKITQLANIEKNYLVLVTPPVEVSTAAIYKAYDKKEINLKIPTEKLVKDINKNKNIDCSLPFANELEKVTEKRIKEVKLIKENLRKFSPELVLMSGSGPSVFAIVKDEKKANKIVKNWSREDDFIYKCYTLKAEIN